MLADSTLTTRSRIDCERVLAGVLERIARLDGMTITESTVVRHPANQRVISEVLAAIAEFPEALAATVKALEKYAP